MLLPTNSVPFEGLYYSSRIYTTYVRKIFYFSSFYLLREIEIPYTVELGMKIFYNHGARHSPSRLVCPQSVLNMGRQEFIVILLDRLVWVN